MKKMKSLVAMFLALSLTVALPVQVKAEGAVYKTDSETTAAESLNPVIAKSGTTEEINASVQLLNIMTSGTKTYSLPLIAEKGGVMDIFFETEQVNPSGTISYTLTSDAEGTNVIYKNSFVAQAGDTSASVEVEKGTYYVNFTLETTDTTIDKANVYFYGIIYPSGTQTLKNKEIIAVSGLEKGTLYKYTASSSGYLILSASASNNVSVKLYNSAKKAVSKETVLYSKDDAAQFAVDKGTYYFKVTSKSDVVYLLAGMDKITDKAGSSASKAKALKVNSTTEGLITAKDKKGKTDYYQVNVSSAGKLKGLYVDFIGTGSVKVTIKIPGLSAKTATVKSGTSIKHILTETMNNGNGSYYRDGKYPKGTYTIKIQKNDSTSSGVYTIITKDVN